MNDYYSIESSFELLSAIQTEVFEVYSRLFDITEYVINERDKLLSELPYHINLIDELRINENAHSRILAKLLQYRNQDRHYELLESFVEYIKNNYGRVSEEFDTINIISPIITQEKRRIDLWVRDSSSNCALIFENKIYDANDQESQLYRYIEETRNAPFDDNRIFVFYLTKFEKEPSNQTWGDNETKQLFKTRFVNLTFRYDILNWLNNCVRPNIRPQDIYLSSAVIQYVDFLEGLFSIRDIDKSINMELQDIISKKLGLQNCGEDESLDKIQATINDFQDILNQLASMRDQILNKKKLERRQKWEQYLALLVPQTKSIGSKFGLIPKLGFDNEHDSRLYISFRKDDWKLSIVLMRYDDESAFIYVGKTDEKPVDEFFLNSGNLIFDLKSYPGEHPYGWEWYGPYNKKAENFVGEIQNGLFESNFSQEIEKILKKINNQNIKMK